MIDHKKNSGINFELNGESTLVYKKEDYPKAVDWVKSFDDGKYAYAEPTTSLGSLYFGARYMEAVQDEEIFSGNDFMADLTVLNSGKVGKEFVKTVGHYHGKVAGHNVAYPEVYEAVFGDIEYLLQTEPDEDGKVDVIWAVAKAGEKVVMPPGWGHVSMNVGSEQAVEIDIQKRDNPNNSDYTMFKEKKGGAVYRTEDGLAENPNYDIRSLRIVKPLEKPEWGIVFTKPLYELFVEAPEKFEWLLRPQDFEFNLDELFADTELAR